MTALDFNAQTPPLASTRRSERIVEGFRRDPLPVPPGNTFVRLITARAIASACHTKPADVASYLWPSDAIVQRAVAAPATTGTTGWAAELVRKVIVDAVEALGAASSGAQLLKAGLVLNWAGAGILAAPGFVAGAGNASFVAEGAPIPVRQLSAAGPSLTPFKLSAIAVLTREMMESSSAEQMIGDTLIRAAGLALDAALFDNSAASSARPAGLRNGISTTTASASTDFFEAALEDFATLVNAVSAVGGTGPFAFVMSPGRAFAVHGRLWRIDDMIDNGFSVLPSSAVGNDLIAVAPA